MAKAKDKKRLAQLRDLIAYHRTKYHTEDAPEISDEAYDALLFELRELEMNLDGQVTTADVVGATVSEAFSKVTHAVPQWSFDNVFAWSELQDWDGKARRLLVEADTKSDYTYVAEHKIDGLKLVMTYENGRLVRAVTRGDGVVGEDVTHTAKTIKSLPLTLTAKVNLICVGEVWLSKSDFDTLNETRKQAGESLFANPRNAAAGSLRQLDPKVAAARNLSLFCYDIDRFEAQKAKLFAPQTQHEELALLTTLGLPTNPHARLCRKLDEVQTFYDEWKDNKESLDYGVDGVVVKINEIGVQNILGYTAKAPRFGIAYKFPAEQRTTIVEAIELQVGRTGVVTPVAHLRPVLIAGSTVSRATLHNEDQIKKLDIRVGDTIILQKAGDVIPEIVSVLLPLRGEHSKPFVFPTHVSGCGGDGKIERIPGESAYRCVVLDSPLILRRRLYYFVSKTALNIDGVGPKLIDQLLDQELISSPADLFMLTYDDIRHLDGFKDKSAANVILAMQKAKVQPLYRLLTALGIDEVGEETARLLADRFGSIPAIIKASQEELAAVYGIGPVVAQNLKNWLANPAHLALLHELMSHIKIVADPNTAHGSSTLQGLTIVATGTLDSFSRDEIKDVIRRHGGTVSSSVSKKTSFVVVGKEAGSKAAEAVRLGVPTLTEAEFLQRIAGKSTK